MKSKIKSLVPKLNMRKRVSFMIIMTLIILISLSIRVAWLQIVDGAELSAQALEQQTRDKPINAARGDILDRNGVQLATSISCEIVSATPKMVLENTNKGISLEAIATEVARILEIDKDALYKKLNNSSYYEIVKKKVDKAQADELRSYIQTNKIQGFYFTEDVKRSYPLEDFASQVIGFVGSDNQGLEGIEAVMDATLSGVNGRVISSTNANGMETPFDYEQYVDPQDGTNVVLTIDETIQSFAEKHLQQAVEENLAKKGGAAIIMDVQTGEILAMATMPKYNLNEPYTLSTATKDSIALLATDEEKNIAESMALQQLWRNKGVVDTYEPGSTFKVFVAAMGLEENVVTLEDRFHCSGHVTVDGTNIRCWKTAGHGSESFVEGIENSCNPVLIDIGARVGADKFYKYYKGFGFTERTGIELFGEAVGPFHSMKNFNKIELATSSFGQSFQVTPLQMIAGVAAIANNGTLLKPRIVKELKDSNGNIVKAYEPEIVRQIISKETSSTLRTILEKVVSEGTGSNAYVAGYRVAGKTGTSEKLEMINGKMQRAPGKYIASFGGFAPADNPKIACIVILDEPNPANYYGGVIAAPVVGKIMQDTLSYLQIEPQYTADELAKMDIVVPDLSGITASKAKETIVQKQLKYTVVGSGENVINQMPKAGQRISASSIITIYTDGSETKMVTVPSFKDMTITQATLAASNVGLNIKISGAGSSQGASASGTIAFTQSIAAGTSVETGTVITIDFRTLDVDE